VLEDRGRTIPDKAGFLSENVGGCAVSLRPTLRNLRWGIAAGTHLTQTDESYSMAWHVGRSQQLARVAMLKNYQSLWKDAS
jgi:hypothetical protein